MRSVLVTSYRKTVCRFRTGSAAETKVAAKPWTLLIFRAKPVRVCAGAALPRRLAVAQELGGGDAAAGRAGFRRWQLSSSLDVMFR